MTNEQIDKLEGQDLRKAVAGSLGWVRLPFPAIPNWQRPTDKGTEVALSIPDWPADISAAWMLLDGFEYDVWYIGGKAACELSWIDKLKHDVGAYDCPTAAVAICRAFLKSRNDIGVK